MRNRKKSREKFFHEMLKLGNATMKKKFEGEIINREIFSPLAANDIIFWLRKAKQKKAAKMFKNHLAMIGYNESPNKKAKFWQSYIRSLKGELWSLQQSSEWNLLNFQHSQDPRISAPTKAVRITVHRITQSTMNRRLPVVESPLPDTVTYQSTGKLMDTHHVPSTHIHHNDQVCTATTECRQLI